MFSPLQFCRDRDPNNEVIQTKGKANESLVAISLSCSATASTKKKWVIRLRNIYQNRLTFADKAPADHHVCPPGTKIR